MRIISFFLLLNAIYGFSPAVVHFGHASFLSTTSLHVVSRREILDLSATVMAGLLLSQPVGPALAADNKPRSILLTGGNSGIGFEAATKLARAGHKIILPCRTLDKAVAAASTIGGDNVIPAECDLSDLTSIDNFIKDLPSLLGNGNSLDISCLNAGLSRNAAATDILRTKDGFELTVGTNHLGHFYLQKSILPMMQTKSHIVVTASGVHDPESPGGAQGKTATLGELLGFERDGKNFEMVDGNPFNADKAYKDSKLCNVLFTRELQRRLEESPVTAGISVNCFNPGLIVSTGLFRDQPKIFTSIFDVVATDLFKVGETPEWGGEALAYMTGVATKGKYYSSPPGSSRYGEAAFGNQFGLTTPSVESLDDTKAKRLWELSAKLVGLNHNMDNFTLD